MCAGAALGSRGATRSPEVTGPCTSIWCAGSIIWGYAIRAMPCFLMDAWHAPTRPKMPNARLPCLLPWPHVVATPVLLAILPQILLVLADVFVVCSCGLWLRVVLIPMAAYTSRDMTQKHFGIIHPRLMPWTWHPVDCGNCLAHAPPGVLPASSHTSPATWDRWLAVCVETPGKVQRTQKKEKKSNVVFSCTLKFFFFRLPWDRKIPAEPGEIQPTKDGSTRFSKQKTPKERNFSISSLLHIFFLLKLQQITIEDFPITAWVIELLISFTESKKKHKSTIIDINRNLFG